MAAMGWIAEMRLLASREGKLTSNHPLSSKIVGLARSTLVAAASQRANSHHAGFYQSTGRGRYDQSFLGETCRVQHVEARRS